MRSVSTEKVPGHNVFELPSGVIFSSNFDNGNLARVEKSNRSGEYNVWTANDNMGTPVQSSHCAFFHFVVSGLEVGTVLKIRVCNASNHGALYKHDHRPVFRSTASNRKWARIRSPVKFTKADGSANLYFEHTVDLPDDKIYFAFTYPYSYAMVQDDMKVVRNHMNDLSNPDSIFMHHEVLTHSCDGRFVDLVTISSAEGADEGAREVLLSGLFPENGPDHPRPPSFPDKEVIFLSCRVHPGEVPAQWTFKGMMDILMDPTDLRGKELRRRFVFKMIPLLNPDGVYRGHFRMDQHGNNLNRYHPHATRHTTHTTPCHNVNLLFVLTNKRHPSRPLIGTTRLRTRATSPRFLQPSLCLTITVLKECSARTWTATHTPPSAGASSTAT